MPTPAWCELCLAPIPYTNQAEVLSGRGQPRDHKGSFAAPMEPPKSSISFKIERNWQASYCEMVCAAAGCNGRVSYQVGDKCAVGRCGKCGLRQNPPTPVEYA